jgi:hypothetical protein
MIFTKLLDIIKKKLMLQNLNKCQELASKYGLSNMTMGEINSEVMAARRNAKNSN